MKYLPQAEVKDKRVLLRVDFNVPITKKGDLIERGDWRLKATLPTLEYLIKNQAKTIIIAHLKNPKGERIEHLKLNKIASRLENLLGRKVTKLDECTGSEVKKIIGSMKSGDIVMLENIRFYAGETENDVKFAQELAELGDIYVNDSFGVDHRKHASLVGIPKYLPSYGGFVLKNEVEVLSKVLNNSRHPLVVIIGGAKISTKIRLIKNFIEKADHLLLGGALANTIFCAKGICIGKSVVERAMISEVKELELGNAKLHTPVDAVVAKSTQDLEGSRIAPIGKTGSEEMILDIGPDTVALYRNIINSAQTIIWNGPMGYIETKEFSHGTRKIARFVADSKAFSVVGGGETISLLERLNLINKINHVSTGGGSMLKFLSGDKLPGIEALK